MPRAGLKEGSKIRRIGISGNEAVSMVWREDPFTLEQIRQIHGTTGVVSAVSDVPAGEMCPSKNRCMVGKERGLNLARFENFPVQSDRAVRTGTGIWEFSENTVESGPGFHARVRLG